MSRSRPGEALAVLVLEDAGVDEADGVVAGPGLGAKASGSDPDAVAPAAVFHRRRVVHPVRAVVAGAQVMGAGSVGRSGR